MKQMYRYVGAALVIVVAALFCAAQSVTRQKQVVLLVVMDTGTNLDSPDLQKSFWEYECEVPNNGKDDDKNNYIDDHIGFDAMANKGSGSGRGHGLMVSAVGACEDDNRLDIPENIRKFIRIVPVKVMHSGQSGKASVVIRALVYALQMQERTGLKMVINMSFVFPDGYIQEVYDLLVVARSRGILIVAAAGNGEGQPVSYPAAYNLDNIISVSGSDGAELGKYSNIHSDIAAEGYASLDKGMLTGEGTSFAAPRVSAVASGVFVCNTSWTYREVRKHVLNKADSVKKFQFKVKNNRKLNAQKALAMK